MKKKKKDKTSKNVRLLIDLSLIVFVELNQVLWVTYTDCRCGSVEFRTGFSPLECHV